MHKTKRFSKRANTREHDIYTGEVVDKMKKTSCSEKFRQLDMFGIPVSLTH